MYRYGGKYSCSWYENKNQHHEICTSIPGYFLHTRFWHGKFHFTHSTHCYPCINRCQSSQGVITDQSQIIIFTHLAIYTNEVNGSMATKYRQWTHLEESLQGISTLKYKYLPTVYTSEHHPTIVSHTQHNMNN